jgi:RHS repeat-associated protein
LCCVSVLASVAILLPVHGVYANIVNQTYGWDTAGNLTDRSDRYDATNSLSENFGYDALNRLVSYQTSSPELAGLSKDVTLAYNAIGNILSKSDVGTYSYPASGATAVRPGAVSSITGPSARTYTYDAAGNLTSSSGGKYTNISYTSFNLPTSMSGGAASYTWYYGPDHERVREQKGARTTWYFHPDNQGGLAYELEGNIQRHYVTAMGRPVGMFETKTETETPTTVTRTHWWHVDHLGSVVAISNGNRVIAQRFSYDPFGKCRQINGTYDEAGTLKYDHPSTPDRGFTGHEHLDDVGVVHMNGRTYDPHIGRFMQADTVIQEPDNAQNYNRFSYVMNNPLNATDPSGHSFKKIVRIAVAIAIAVYAPQMLAAMGETAAIAASCTVQGAAMAGTIAANYAAVGVFAGGFGAGVVGSGSLEGGIQGAVTAGLFHGAAGFGAANSPERYAAQRPA